MNNTIYQLTDLIYNEIDRAMKLHPGWPEDIIHQVSIMNEEAGEAIQAALNLVYHEGDMAHLERELIQTAAMCLRCLEWIKDNDKQMGLF